MKIPRIIKQSEYFSSVIVKDRSDVAKLIVASMDTEQYTDILYIQKDVYDTLDVGDYDGLVSFLRLRYGNFSFPEGKRVLDTIVVAEQ